MDVAIELIGQLLDVRGNIRESTEKQNSFFVGGAINLGYKTNCELLTLMYEEDEDPSSLGCLGESQPKKEETLKTLYKELKYWQ